MRKVKGCGICGKRARYVVFEEDMLTGKRRVYFLCKDCVMWEFAAMFMKMESIGGDIVSVFHVKDVDENKIERWLG